MHISSIIAPEGSAMAARTASTKIFRGIVAQSLISISPQGFCSSHFSPASSIAFAARSLGVIGFPLNHFPLLGLFPDRFHHKLFERHGSRYIELITELAHDPCETVEGSGLRVKLNP